MIWCWIWLQVYPHGNDIHLVEGMNAPPISHKYLLQVLKQKPDSIKWSAPREIIVGKGTSGKLGIKLNGYKVTFLVFFHFVLLFLICTCCIVYSASVYNCVLGHLWLDFEITWLKCETDWGDMSHPTKSQASSVNLVNRSIMESL